MCRSRVFVIGPSHHMFTRQCLLSAANAYTSPQGNHPLAPSVVQKAKPIQLAAACAGEVDIDQDVYNQLLQTGHFESMRLDVDEVLAYILLT